MGRHTGRSRRTHGLRACAVDMFAWFCMTWGAARRIWAYEEIGCGGFGVGNPVENARARVVYGTAVSIPSWFRSVQHACACGTVTPRDISFSSRLFGTFMHARESCSRDSSGEPDCHDVPSAWSRSGVQFGMVIYRLPMLARGATARRGIPKPHSCEQWILRFRRSSSSSGRFPTVSQAIHGREHHDRNRRFSTGDGADGLILLLRTALVRCWMREETPFRSQYQFLWPASVR